MEKDGGRCLIMSKWTFQNDPLPKIPPALLNSADIQAYQDCCDLIQNDPFSLERLKPASYEIGFNGDAYWWDLTGPRKHQRIDGDTPLHVRKNSIVYISPNAKFALPDFIAIRFNLRINLVHRGLLLGTGPLVDPGFEGRLLIPLHNLTSEDIEIDPKEGFIWIEFTKISPLNNPQQKKSLWGQNEYLYREFPESKKNLEPSDYFRGAGGGPFRSSLVDLLEAAKQIEERVRRYAIFGILGLAVAIGSLLLSAYALHVQSANAIRAATQWVYDADKEALRRAADMKVELDSLKASVKALEAKVPVNRSQRGKRQEPQGRNEGSASKAAK
jgi:hypothetical protein